MPNINIGVLLDEFDVKTPEDYSRLSVKDRSIFLSRVQSSAEHTTKDMFDELKHTPGLKMHFQVRHLLQGGWQNIPNETFARKIAFFASKSVITFPFNQLAYWENDDIHSLLTLLCTARPYIKENLVSILPSDDVIEKELRNKKYDLVSANFHLENLETQFEEKVYPTVIANLFLPFFEPIDSKDIIRIRQEEADKYLGFERRLSHLLNESKTLAHEETLLKELENIDNHIRQLNEKYKAIQYAYKKKNISTLIGCATVGLVLFFPPSIVPALASIIGGTTLFEYFKFRMEEASRAITEKQEEYYLLWKVNDLRAHKDKKRSVQN